MQEGSVAEGPKSCLTDKPLEKEEQDNLNAADYARALGEFIRKADTPVTIGIQGGWGSGKTSLIMVLQEQLSNYQEYPAVCALVNAWEHSLFQDTDNKAQVALSLLTGLSTGLKESINNATWLDKDARKIASEEGSKVEAAIGLLKTGLTLAGKIAVQMASNAVGGGDLHDIYISEKDGNTSTVPPLAESVRALRSSLKEMVGKITYHGQQVKVVFFIDDLDRISPPTAVEILDITKNIFDIPNCIFVLAIDYEVVVKGLEEKYGKKTSDNEREFRQYFDKIIQIPFTMPIGVYSKNLGDMLKPALETLGNNSASAELLRRLGKNAELATGGIPRSIKRIINTLSLLRHIADQGRRKNKNLNDKQDYLEARFIVVALHISFPEICRKLMERPDFPSWSLKQLDLPWKLNAKDNQADLEVLSEDDLFNDDWEKVVFCLCSQSSWLKSQAKNVSQLLNNLLRALGDDQENAKELTENGREILMEIVDSIRVVSIDTETQNVPEFNDKSVKSDRVTRFFQKIQDGLSHQLPEGTVPPAKNDDYSGRGEPREYSIGLDNDIEIYFAYFKKDDRISISFWAPYYRLTKNEVMQILEKLAGSYSIGTYRKQFGLTLEERISWGEIVLDNDSINMSMVDELVNKSVRLYEAFLNGREALEKQ